jgi:flagellar hook-associated protein 2
LFTAQRAKKQERLASEGIAERLNDIVRDAIGTNGTISNKAGIKGSYTETNNALKKELEDSSQKISDMMTYLYEKENYYYQLFAKMEAAINKNNNQMASLQSMLGLA